MRSVQTNRLFLSTKHSTIPCHWVPGVGTHRLIPSKSLSPPARAFTPMLIRKNGCHPLPTIDSPSQRAYNPRSASTSTHHSSGTEPFNSCNRSPHYEPQHPLACPPTPPHTT